MKKKEIVEGSIFCIPLFMPKDDWKLKLKLKEEDSDKIFIFGRVIENGGGSGVLVEIFNKTGNLNTKIEDIVNSSLLINPIYIFWEGIIKERWKVVGKTSNYNKIKDSNYNEINIIFGIDDNIRIFNYGSGKEKKITEDEAELLNYEYARTWFPIE